MYAGSGSKTLHSVSCLSVIVLHPIGLLRRTVCLLYLQLSETEPDGVELSAVLNEGFFLSFFFFFYGLLHCSVRAAGKTKGLDLAAAANASVMQFEFGSHEIIYRYTWARLLFSVSQREKKKGAVCLSIDTETNWTQTRLGFVWIFKVLLLLAEESGGRGGREKVLEVNCNGKTKAQSVSNHWGQTGVPLSRKQGSVTPWRNLPVCFIALICCLTSLSPSDYSCSCLPFCPRPQPYTSTSISLPPPSPSLAQDAIQPHLAIRHSLSHPVSLREPRKLIMRHFQRRASPVGPPPPFFSIPTPAPPATGFFASLISPSFH